ncbi:MAG: hypothetical protein E2P04_02075 [Acidobacteria bacterium]|nr:MAG: hypothetical protein E2P04_02075 [Acidobacteriota bacterium]
MKRNHLPSSSRTMGGCASARSLLAALVILSTLWLGGYPAAARAAPDQGEAEKSTDERLSRLEEQLRALQLELVRLRQEKGTNPQRVEALARQMEALARQLQILTQELERQQLGAAYGVADQSIHGLGPAASKVYGREQGVSLGGYGEMVYNNRSSGDDQVDFLRAVFYFGYKFNDRILFNSEIEFEHAKTGEGEDGEVAVEFAYLDFLVRDGFNVRAGLVLLPVGFLNELHEPPIFFGALRPQVERVILPTTWRESGVGAFGEVGPFSYRVYVLNGLDSTGFSASSGLRGGRQDGSKAQANDIALAARVDWTMAPGLQVGFSGYLGDSGQDAEVLGEELEGLVSVFDLHAEWRWRGLRLRGLYARVDIDDAELINHQNLNASDGGEKSIGERLVGWYAEAAYDVLAHLDTRQQLSPYVRYEEYNTQDKVPDGYLTDPSDPFRADPALDVQLLTVGVAFQPIPQVTIKVDFQDFDNQAGTGMDQFNVALGYLF